MKKILEFLMRPYRQYQEKKQLEKRLAQLRKRNPFIYK